MSHRCTPHVPHVFPVPTAATLYSTLRDRSRDLARCRQYRHGKGLARSREPPKDGECSLRLIRLIQLRLTFAPTTSPAASLPFRAEPNSQPAERSFPNDQDKQVLAAPSRGTSIIGTADRSLSVLSALAPAAATTWNSQSPSSAPQELYEQMRRERPMMDEDYRPEVIPQGAR